MLNEDTEVESEKPETVVTPEKPIEPDIDEVPIEEEVTEPVEEVPSEPIEEVYDPEKDLQLQELKKLNETYTAYLEKQEVDRLDKEKKDEEFRSQLIELLTPSDEPVEEVSNEELPLLQALVEQTAPNPEQSKIDTAAYYGNLSIILVVMAILPTYIAYRLFKGVFGLTRHIL